MYIGDDCWISTDTLTIDQKSIMASLYKKQFLMSLVPLCILAFAICSWFSKFMTERTAPKSDNSHFVASANKQPHMVEEPFGLTTMDAKQPTLPPHQIFKPPGLHQYSLPAVVGEEQFTVVMLTHNRTPLMLRSAEHFLKMNRTQKVIVMWNNGNQLFPNVTDLEARTGKPIVFINITEDKLRFRFHAAPEIETQGS